MQHTPSDNWRSPPPPATHLHRAAHLAAGMWMRQMGRVAWLCVCSLIAMHSAAAQPQPVQQPIVIRFSHVVAADTPKGVAALRFKTLVEQQSHGQIKVQVHPNASLYGDRDEIEALQIGAVEMLAPSLSKFGRLGFPEFELFDLPFLFNNIQEVRAIHHSRMGQRLLAKLHQQHLVGLGYLTNGLKQMSAHRPLREPGDFAGLRMRIQSSHVISSQMRALGAYPVNLPFSETYTALQTGVVDGAENALTNFWTQNMHQVQSHLSLTQHGYQGYAVITSERFWLNLAPALQRIVEQALQQALNDGDAIADAQNTAALRAIEQSGTTQIHRLTDVERARLRAVMQPVYTQLGRRIGKHWIDSAETTLHHLRQSDPAQPPR